MWCFGRGAIYRLYGFTLDVVLSDQTCSKFLPGWEKFLSTWILAFLFGRMGLDSMSAVIGECKEVSLHTKPSRRNRWNEVCLNEFIGAFRSFLACNAVVPFCRCLGTVTNIVLSLLKNFIWRCVRCFFNDWKFRWPRRLLHVVRGKFVDDII